MLNHYQNLVRNVRPILISRDDTTVGPRIGGNAPKGITPPTIRGSTRYFTTLTLDDVGNQEISLFTSLDYDDKAQDRSLYKNVSRIFTSEDLVQIVAHSKSERCSTSQLRSDLPGRAMKIQPETPDIVVEPGGELLLPNKLGGLPYFFYGTRGYIESIERLMGEGFLLFVQLSWGGYERSVPFLWPFDQYTFHLLAKETETGITWRYGWG